MSKQSAIEDADVIIRALNDALAAVTEARPAIVAEDPEMLHGAITTLNDIDSIMLESSPINDYLAELEDFDSEGAAVDSEFDHERDSGAIEADAR